MNTLNSLFLAFVFSAIPSLDVNASSSNQKSDGSAHKNWVILSNGQKLPTPLNQDLENSGFGQSMSVGAFFSAIGAPDANGRGAVFTQSFGTAKTQEPLITLYAIDGQAGDQFGAAVSNTADYVLVGAPGTDDVNNDAGSVYVFEDDYDSIFGPTWHHQAKLLASDPQENDYFGHAVSIDGQRFLVGAFGHDSFAEDAGAAFVFEFDGSQWQQTAKLTANDGQAFDHFGWSVHLLGNRAIVGSTGHSNGTSSGAVYVFDFNGVEWVQSAKLMSHMNTVSQLGWSLNQFDSRIIAGAPQDNSSQVGHAIIYRLHEGQWSEETVLEPTNTPTLNSKFGWSVDIKGYVAVVGTTAGQGPTQVYRFENDTWTLSSELSPANSHNQDQFGHVARISDQLAQYILISNPKDEMANGDLGSVHMFTYFGGYIETSQVNANEWTQDDYFGTSVSISGNRALVGAPGDNEFGFDSGSAYIYEWLEGQWQLMAKLQSDDLHPRQEFGHSVSLSGDRALVGAPQDSQDETFSGAAYIFDLIDGDWTQSQKLKASHPRFRANFGDSVSLDGNRALIGAYRDGEAGQYAGAAYVFELNQGHWVETEKLLAATTTIGDFFGVSVSLDNDKAVIGSSSDSTQGNDSGSVYVFTIDNGLWSETAQLSPSDHQAGDGFGNAVDIGGHQILVGASDEGEFSDQAGAAYVFEFDGLDWVEVVKLKPTDGEHRDRFGCSVSLETTFFVVGSCESDEQGDKSGAVYVYHLDTNGLHIVEKFTAENTATRNYFGTSVAINSNRLLIGARGQDGQSSQSGAAHFYQLATDLIFSDTFEITRSPH